MCKEDYAITVRWIMPLSSGDPRMLRRIWPVLRLCELWFMCLLWRVAADYPTA